MAVVMATFQKCGSFNSWMSVKVDVSHAFKIKIPTYEILAVATAGSKQ